MSARNNTHQLHMVIEENFHKALKIAAIERNQSVKDFVVEVMSKEIYQWQKLTHRKNK